MGQRRRSRECALQMLFQIDVTATAPTDVFDEFWIDQVPGDDVRAFAEELVQGVAARKAALDTVISGASEHWRIERMAVVDRNVLRMAIYELLWERETPPAVVIDEAIEVAKRFGGDESGAFVNGVLDAVRRALERGEITTPGDESV